MMDKLLPYGKYPRQTRRTRRMDEQSSEILHLDRLEDGALRKCPGDIFSERAGHKGGGSKRRCLLRLGVDQDHAYTCSRTRKGLWAVAQSPVLITNIILKRLEKRGHAIMLEHF